MPVDRFWASRITVVPAGMGSKAADMLTEADVWTSPDPPQEDAFKVDSDSIRPERQIATKSPDNRLPASDMGHAMDARVTPLDELRSA